MRKIPFKPIKAGKDFHKELSEIQKKRWMGIDKTKPKPVSTTRLTNKMVKYPEWIALKNKLLREPRKEDLY